MTIDYAWIYTGQDGINRLPKLSYLDIVAADRTEKMTIEAALDEYRAKLFDPQPADSANPVGLRFNATPGLRAVPAKYVEEFRTLGKIALLLL